MCLKEYYMFRLHLSHHQVLSIYDAIHNKWLCQKVILHVYDLHLSQ
jgi:hypothetical protein